MAFKNYQVRMEIKFSFQFISVVEHYQTLILILHTSVQKIYRFCETPL